MGDPARGDASRILSENPADDLSFCLDDLQLAALALDGPVSIRTPARVPTLDQHCFHPTPNLPLHVLPIKLPDQAAQANRNRVCAPFVSRPDQKAVKGKSFVNMGEVLHVARESVK